MGAPDMTPRTIAPSPARVARQPRTKRPGAARRAIVKVDVPMRGGGAGAEASSGGPAPSESDGSGGRGVGSGDGVEGSGGCGVTARVADPLRSTDAAGARHGTAPNVRSPPVWPPRRSPVPRSDRSAHSPLEAAGSSPPPRHHAARSP